MYRPRVSECAGLEGLEVWEGFCSPIPREPPKPPVPAGGRGVPNLSLIHPFFPPQSISSKESCNICRPRKFRGCSKPESELGNERRYARRERSSCEGDTSAKKIFFLIFILFQLRIPLRRLITGQGKGREGKGRIIVALYNLHII